MWLVMTISNSTALNNNNDKSVEQIEVKYSKVFVYSEGK